MAFSWRSTSFIGSSLPAAAVAVQPEQGGGAERADLGVDARGRATAGQIATHGVLGMGAFVRDDRRQRRLVSTHPAVVDLDRVARHAVARVDAGRHRDEADRYAIRIEHPA